MNLAHHAERTNIATSVGNDKQTKYVEISPTNNPQSWQNATRGKQVTEIPTAMGASTHGKTMVKSCILRKKTRADGKLGNAPNGKTMDGGTTTVGAEMNGKPKL